ncbi:MAG TPA: DUF4139 domain-containing protein [Candidatus Saccharimonadales bacterium]|nr:DUF4139 domain-containing protein [Candidatus Saccharimonadales bacterium]
MSKLRFCWIPFLVTVFCVSPAMGRINVVTLPERDTVQLTIYNSVDLTLVKETRHLTFRKGLNKLEFSWANTLIDPTSVEFRALTHADDVEVLDVSFPARVTNTLEWRINSEVSGEITVEIRYFTSGIAWSADYVAEAAQNEKLMTLAGNVRVTNNSGEDYENAQVRLVVGVIRLVEEIAQLARDEMKAKEQLPGAMPMTEALTKSSLNGRFYRMAGLGGGGAMDAKAKVREVIKEGLSEYFLYTVEGRDTIPNTWSKRLPSFKTAEVPVTSYYKFEMEIYGEDVHRFYRFTNSVASKLGAEPLPDGSVYAVRIASADNRYTFLGRTAVKYIPVNENVELELGLDREVLVKPKLMTWEKTGLQFDNGGNVNGWTVKETWQIALQNSKDIDVVLDIRRNFPGDWSIETPDKYEKVDATKIKFLQPLAARTKQTITYQLTTRFGSSATR